ncbi:MAG TPA: PTS sugar transporter subunit IIB [Anaerolineaceae bacterium]|jgi:PTS system cellobiose-specific IIB component|nr:PTS sugar transporter subunit IIB [Anaerolineaceae bacterium]
MVYNIILICQWGASTGMLVEKMLEAAAKKNIEVAINAYPEAKLDDYIGDADIVLLAPQVRFKKDAFEEKYKANNVPFMVVDTADYGMLNGEKVLNAVFEKLENERR